MTEHAYELIGFVLVFLMQTIGGLIWLAKLGQRVDTLEKTVIEIDTVVKVRSGIIDKMAAEISGIAAHQQDVMRDVQTIRDRLNRHLDFLAAAKSDG